MSGKNFLKSEHLEQSESWALGSLDLLGQAWVLYQRPESLRVLSSISIVPKTEVGLGSMGA